MKKTLKRIFLLVLACALSFSLLACGSKDKDGEKEPNNTGTTGVDFSQYPSDFNEWKIADMQKYMQDTGVFKESSWLMPIPADQCKELGITGSIYYMDQVSSTIYDGIFYFDPASTDEAVKKQFENVKTTKALTDGAGGALMMDKMLGNFAVTYSKTVDNDHKEAFIKALDDLAAHFNITAEF